jgi:hypothetical protein
VVVHKAASAEAIVVIRVDSEREETSKTIESEELCYNQKEQSIEDIRKVV